MAEGAGPGTGLRVEGLALTFPGPVPVLDGVGFSVAGGEFVSVVGPSGCGKSTLFNVIAGLRRPDAGRVLVDGADATGRTEPFAYMPQQDLLFPWRSVLANVTLGLEVAGVPRRVARQRARPLLAPFGLAGFERSRPAQLSGGMRQRAALLRTVIQERAVLLLDEPFGALDSLTRLDMQTWLDELRRRFSWTVLLVTHDIREAVYLSDRILVLGPRPTWVRDEIAVELPRPRTPAMLTSPGFAIVEERVLGAVRARRGAAP